MSRKAQETADRPEAEHAELAGIYIDSGLESGLAHEVARQLMAKDALGAHAHDEIGLTPGTAARPIQAALTSAATFSVGAAMPLLMAAVAPTGLLAPLRGCCSFVFLATLGARTGGAGIQEPTVRVTFRGALAMAVTSAVGAMFGTVG